MPATHHNPKLMQGTINSDELNYKLEILHTYNIVYDSINNIQSPVVFGIVICNRLFFVRTKEELKIVEMENADNTDMRCYVHTLEKTVRIILTIKTPEYAEGFVIKKNVYTFEIDYNREFKTFSKDAINLHSIIQNIFEYDYSPINSYKIFFNTQIFFNTPGCAIDSKALTLSLLEHQILK